MRLAFVMVLLGYGTKAGLAPMHTWKPDAYAEAPVPAATLLGAAFINCAIYAIMRFDVLAEKCLGHQFPSELLVGFGVFSILLAAPFVLVQRNFRRLLAYSSIDHAGIMVAAVGFGGKLGAAGRGAAHALSRDDQTAHVLLRRKRAAALRLALLPQGARGHSHAAVDGRLVPAGHVRGNRHAALQHLPKRVHRAERGAGGRSRLGGRLVRARRSDDLCRLPAAHVQDEPRRGAGDAPRERRSARGSWGRWCWWRSW